MQPVSVPAFGQALCVTAPNTARPALRPSRPGDVFVRFGAAHVVPAGDGQAGIEMEFRRRLAERGPDAVRNAITFVVEHPALTPEVRGRLLLGLAERLEQSRRYNSSLWQELYDLIVPIRRPDGSHREDLELLDASAHTYSQLDMESILGIADRLVKTASKHPDSSALKKQLIKDAERLTSLPALDNTYGVRLMLYELVLGILADDSELTVRNLVEQSRERGDEMEG